MPSNQISTIASGLSFSRLTQTFNGTITIKNVNTAAINGPLQIVLTSLTAGVTLTNATGIFAGMPYQIISGITFLVPGQSATIPVRFTNPYNATINFTPVVYSGSLN